MKILSGSQIKEADKYTIENEPISSLALMERASLNMSNEIIKIFNDDIPLLFLIGKGNNAGDGLAMARILSEKGYRCRVYCIFQKEDITHECKTNLDRLPADVEILSSDIVPQNIPVNKNTLIIDAILGSGIKGVIKEPISNVIEWLNNLPNQVISIDLPSGMKTEWNEKDDKSIVKADYTLTIEFPKIGMLLPDVGEYSGKIIIVPIGLNERYINEALSNYNYTDRKHIESLFEKRTKFAYKNTQGHALMICGSKRMSGAATLATAGALRSGCGLVTTHLPYDARYGIMANYSSAMLSFDEGDSFTMLPSNLDKYTVIGVGCGIGQTEETASALGLLLETVKYPVVIDADALNIIALHKDLYKFIPQNSVLTPHIGELRRLVGDWQSEQHKIELVRQLASELQSVIIVKGAYTMICLPDGNCYFNSTGNAGMAKGGSGDILTGLITGLIARGYSSTKAAIIGVYVHGLAGDMAASELGQEAMNSHDIVDYLPKAFLELNKY